MIPAMWRCYVEACASGQISDATQQKAADKIAADSKRKARVRAKARPRREREGAASLSDDLRHASIIAKVMARPGPECELGQHATGNLVDPHHLEGGSNRRNERVSNIIRACRACHDAYHSNAAMFVPVVKAWCAEHGYPLPSRKEYR